MDRQRMERSEAYMEAELEARRRSVNLQVKQRSDAWRTYVHALLPTAAGMHIDEHRLLQLQHSKSTQLLTHSALGAGGAAGGDGGAGGGCGPPPFAWRPSSAESLSAAHELGALAAPSCVRGGGGEGGGAAAALPSMISLPSLTSQLIDDKRSLLASVRQMLASPCRSMDGITPLAAPVRLEPAPVVQSPLVKVSRSASASRFRSKPRPASSGAAAQRPSPSRAASAGMLRPQSAFVKGTGPRGGHPALTQSIYDEWVEPRLNGTRLDGTRLDDEWVDPGTRLAHELD